MSVQEAVEAAAEMPPPGKAACLINHGVSSLTRNALRQRRSTTSRRPGRGRRRWPTEPRTPRSATNKPHTETLWPQFETAPPIYATRRWRITSAPWGASTAPRPGHALRPLKIELIRQGTAWMRQMIARTPRRTGITRWTKSSGPTPQRSVPLRNSRALSGTSATTSNEFRPVSRHRRLSLPRFLDQKPHRGLAGSAVEPPAVGELVEHPAGKAGRALARRLIRTELSPGVSSAAPFISTRTLLGRVESVT